LQQQQQQQQQKQRCNRGMVPPLAWHLEHEDGLEGLLGQG